MTISAVIFNNRVGRLSGRVSDPSVLTAIGNEKAYKHATRAYLDFLPNVKVRSQVIDIFAKAVKSLWFVTILFAG